MEAARLLLRGKENDYVAARKRAARWLSRRKLDAADIPTAAEIQTQLFALSGLFAEEHQTAARAGMRAAALELMDILQDFDPHVSGSAIDGTVTAGAALELDVQAESASAIAERLQEAGFRTRITSANGSGEVVSLNHGFPCEIRVDSQFAQSDADVPSEADNNRFDMAGLQHLVAQAASAQYDDIDDSSAEVEVEHEYHRDAFAVFEMLLEPLEQIQLDPQSHPEGDALYHSLQTFELGLDEHPYDEEFLLACLLHEAGLSINRREPVRALLQVVGDLITDRTCFLIENLAAASEFLRSGNIAPALRRSEDFDELMALALCDRDARLPGAEVRELADALEYIAGIESAWDDVSSESA